MEHIFSDDGNFDFKYIYRIGQFPVLEYFKNYNIDNSNDEFYFKNYNFVQQKINEQDKRIKFYKTHSAYFKNENQVLVIQKTHWVQYILLEIKKCSNFLLSPLFIGYR